MTGEAQCHWTHVHGRHEWTPLVPEPGEERVLNVFPDSPIECPGLTAEQVANRAARGTGVTGTVSVDVSAPNVMVRGSNIWVRPLDGDGEPVRIGPGWSDVGYTEDGPVVAASAGTHDAPMSLDLHLSPRQRAAMLHMLAGRWSRKAYSLSVTQEFCPIVAPEKGRRLTGKAYRIARRRYARAMRQWRRDGSPMATRLTYMPHVHIHAPEGRVRGISAASITTIIDEAEETT